MQNPFVPDCNLLQALEQCSITVSCMNGRILFKQGESPLGLYVLKSGIASLLIKTENGKEVAHLTVGPGSILGLPVLVANERHCLSALAYKSSEVSFIARKDFEELMQSEPCLFPKVLEILAKEVRAARLVLSALLWKLGSRPQLHSAGND